MKILNLFIVSIVLLLLMPVKILAQKQVVKGRVVLCNALQQTEALPYANIALIQLPDSTFVTGAVSDEQGKFTCSFSRKRITAIFSKYPIQDVVRYLKPSHPSRTQCVWVQSS